MYGAIIIKLVVGMIGVLFFLRLAGKTQMAQMTPTDTVNSFVVGALIGGIIYSPTLTIWDMLYAIAIWAIINLIVRFLSKYNFFNRLFHGESEYIIRDGVMNIKVMEKNNLGLDQLVAKLRSLDINSLQDVDVVRFETDGQLTIHKKKEFPASYLMISNGEVLDESLKDSGKSKEWLLRELSKDGYKDIKSLFCVQWTDGHGFYVVNNEGNISVDAKKETKKKEKESA